MLDTASGWVNGQNAEDVFRVMEGGNGSDIHSARGTTTTTIHPDVAGCLNGQMNSDKTAAGMHMQGINGHVGLRPSGTTPPSAPCRT